MEKVDTWEEEIDTAKEEKAVIGISLLLQFLQSELRFFLSFLAILRV